MRTFCLFVVLAFASNSFAENTKLRVAAILALSGDAAPLAEGCRNGIRLAQEEHPDAVEVRFEDDANEPSRTVTAYQRQANQNDAVLTWTSSVSNAVAPLAERQKRVLVAIATDPKVVQGKQYVFNYWVTPEAEVDVMLKEMKRRRISSVARVTTMQDALISFKRIMDARLSEAKARIVFDVDTVSFDNDFRMLLTRLKQAGPVDGIFANLYVGQVGLFARQARELGITAPLFNIETAEDPAAQRDAQGALDGQWYVNAGDPDEKFLKRYRKQFPNASTFSAANCYDVINLLVMGRKDPSLGLHVWLRSVRNFVGANGTISATGDNRFSLPATVKIIAH